jgi:Fe-S-cluster-containing hydrogenase component 2
MEAPVCIDVCPTEALELVDINQYEEFLRSRRNETATDLKSKDAPGGRLLLDLIKESGTRT